MTKRRSYPQLVSLGTFEERFEYLSLRGELGAQTFGAERYLNQAFYRSRQWKLVRDEVISRDMGRDLGIPGHEIFDRVLVHHMNPMTIEDVDGGNPEILDPNFLITVSHLTHNAIHYGNIKTLPIRYVPRERHDTVPWKRR